MAELDPNTHLLEEKDDTGPLSTKKKSSVQERLKAARRMAQTRGSQSITVPGTFGEYDPDLKVTPDKNFNELRAASQGNFELLGKAAFQSVGTIIGMTIEGIGSLGEAPFKLAGVDTGHEANSIEAIGEGLREWSTEYMQIYQTELAQSDSWGRFLDPTFHASHAPSVASTVGLLIPGLAAAKGASLLGNALKLYKMGKGAIPAIATVSSSMASREVEAQMEQRESYNQNLQKYLDQGLSQQEAKERASMIAADVYKSSWSNIAIDVLQWGTLLKGTNLVNRNLKNSFVDIAQKNDDDFATLLKQTLEKNPNLTVADAVKKTSALRKSGEFLGQMITEGFEEANIEIQKLRAIKNADILSGAVKGDMRNMLDVYTSGDFTEYIGDKDVINAAFFGAIGGGGFHAIGKLGAKLMNREDVEDQAQRSEILRQQTTRMHDKLKVIRELTATGDEVGAREMFNSMVSDLAVKGMITDKGYTQGAASFGNLDNVKEMFRGVQNLTPEQLEQLELDQNTVQQAERALKELDKIEEIYNKHSNKAYGTQIDDLINVYLAEQEYTNESTREAISEYSNQISEIYADSATKQLLNQLDSSQQNYIAELSKLERLEKIKQIIQKADSSEVVPNINKLDILGKVRNQTLNEINKEIEETKQRIKDAEGAEGLLKKDQKSAVSIKNQLDKNDNLRRREFARDLREFNLSEGERTLGELLKEGNQKAIAKAIKSNREDIKQAVQKFLVNSQYEDGGIVQDKSGQYYVFEVGSDGKYRVQKVNQQLEYIEGEEASVVKDLDEFLDEYSPREMDYVFTKEQFNEKKKEVESHLSKGEFPEAVNILNRIIDRSNYSNKSPEISQVIKSAIETKVSNMTSIKQIKDFANEIDNYVSNRTVRDNLGQHFIEVISEIRKRNEKQIKRIESLIVERKENIGKIAGDIQSIENNILDITEEVRSLETKLKETAQNKNRTQKSILKTHKSIREPLNKAKEEIDEKLTDLKKLKTKLQGQRREIEKDLELFNKIREKLDGDTIAGVVLRDDLNNMLGEVESLKAEVLIEFNLTDYGLRKIAKKYDEGFTTLEDAILLAEEYRDTIVALNSSNEVAINAANAAFAQLKKENLIEDEDSVIPISVLDKYRRLYNQNLTEFAKRNLGNTTTDKLARQSVQTMRLTRADTSEFLAEKTKHIREHIPEVIKRLRELKEPIEAYQQVLHAAVTSRVLESEGTTEELEPEETSTNYQNSQRIPEHVFTRFSGHTGSPDMGMSSDPSQRRYGRFVNYTDITKGNFKAKFVRPQDYDIDISDLSDYYKKDEVLYAIILDENDNYIDENGEPLKEFDPEKAIYTSVPLASYHSEKMSKTYVLDDDDGTLLLTDEQVKELYPKLDIEAGRQRYIQYLENLKQDHQRFLNWVHNSIEEGIEPVRVITGKSRGIVNEIKGSPKPLTSIFDKQDLLDGTVEISIEQGNTMTVGGENFAVSPQSVYITDKYGNVSQAYPRKLQQNEKDAILNALEYMAENSTKKGEGKVSTEVQIQGLTKDKRDGVGDVYFEDIIKEYLLFGGKDHHIKWSDDKSIPGGYMEIIFNERDENGTLTNVRKEKIPLFADNEEGQKTRALNPKLKRVLSEKLDQSYANPKSTELKLEEPFTSIVYEDGKFVKKVYGESSEDIGYLYYLIDRNIVGTKIRDVSKEYVETKIVDSETGEVHYKEVTEKGLTHYNQNLSFDNSLDQKQEQVETEELQDYVKSLDEVGGDITFRKPNAKTIVKLSKDEEWQVEVLNAEEASGDTDSADYVNMIKESILPIVQEGHSMEIEVLGVNLNTEKGEKITDVDVDPEIDVSLDELGDIDLQRKASDNPILTRRQLSALSKGLADRTGIPIHIFNEERALFHLEYLRSIGEIDEDFTLDTIPKGMHSRGIAYVFSEDAVTAETPFHEISHPIVNQIISDNPVLFDSLIEEIFSTSEGREIVAYVQKEYPKATLNGKLTTNGLAEIITTAIGREAAGMYNDKSAISRVVKDFWERIKQFFRELFGEGYVQIESLSKDTTIRDIASLLAESQLKFTLTPSSVTQFEAQQGINYTLTIINSLEKMNRNKFSKQKKQGWINDLKKYPGVSDTHIEMFESVAEDGMTREEIILEMVSKYSFAVEVETATTNVEQDIEGQYININGTLFEWGVEGWFKEDRDQNRIPPTEEELKLINDKIEEKGAELSQVYQSLSVPGGTNYTENRIITPQIEPSIKGHAAFAETNDIGWFRSDEQLKDSKLRGVPEGEERTAMEAARLEKVPFYDITEGTPTKTRRILEFQSDLFQTRDLDSLVKNNRIEEGRKYFDLLAQLEYTIKGYDRGTDGGYSPDENVTMPSTPSTLYIEYEDGSTTQLYDRNISKLIDRSIEPKRLKELRDSKEDFLGLLMNDNNWVTFFIKSIVQDSAKKGYEKVLFPKGDTAAKIEGHETISEVEDSIKEEIRMLKATDDWRDIQRYYPRLLLEESPVEVKDQHQFQGTHLLKYDNYIEGLTSSPEGEVFYIDGVKYESDTFTGEQWFIDENDQMQMISGEEFQEAYNNRDNREVKEPSISRTIEYLNNKLEFLEKEGFSQLQPIAKFYEKDVTNILRKQYGKKNVKRVTDEYGNEWSQIEIDSQRDLGQIEFQRKDQDKSKQEDLSQVFKSIEPKHILPGTNSAFTKDAMEATNYMFFKELFDSEHFLPKLFSKSGLDKDSYRALMDNVLERFKNTKKILLSHPSITEKQAKLYGPRYDYVIENFDDVVRLHQDHLRQYNIEAVTEDTLEQEFTEERDVNSLWTTESLKYSSKQSATNSIRILVGSLRKNRSAENKSFALSTNVDFGATFNLLANELSGLTSLEEMVEHVRSLKQRNADGMVSLLDRILEKVDNIKSLTHSDVTSLLEFRQTFAKNYNNYSIIFHGDQGTFNISDINVNSARNRVIAKWQTNIRLDKPYFKEEGNAVVYDIDKMKKDGLLGGDGLRNNDRYLPDNHQKMGGLTREYMRSKNFLLELGLDITSDTLPSDNFNRIVNKIYDNLSKREDYAYDILSPFSDNKGNLNVLLEHELTTSLDAVENQHQRSTGETIYNVNLFSYATYIGNKINMTNSTSQKVSDLEALKRELPFLSSRYTNHSELLTKILYKNGKRTDKDFRIHFVNEYKNEVSGEVTSFDSSSKSDQVLLTLNAANEGSYPILRAGDNSIERHIDMGVFYTSDQIESGNHYQTFINYLIDEIHEIHDIKNRDDKYFKVSDKSIDDLISMFPVTGLLSSNATLKKNIKQAIENNDTSVVLSDKLQNTIHTKINQFVNDQYEATRKYLEFNKIIEKDGNQYRNRGVTGLTTDGSEYVKPTNLQKVVQQAIVNRFIANVEQTKLLVGPLVYYGNADNVFKRMSGFVGTKEMAAVGHFENQVIEEFFPRNNSTRLYKEVNADGKLSDSFTTYSKGAKPIMKTALFKELIVKSAYLDMLKDEKVDTSEYDGMQEADAIGWVSLDGYRDLMLRTGKWTMELERLYQWETRPRDESGRPLNAVMSFNNWYTGEIEEIKSESQLTNPNGKRTTFNMLKPQYFGALAEEGFIPGMYKTAFLPVLPSYTRKYPAFKKLYDYQNENNIDLVTMPSANKVGTRSKEDGSLPDTYVDKEADFSDGVIQNTYYEFWGIQLETGNDVKDEVIKASQISKLIYSNIYDKGSVEGNEDLAELAGKLQSVNDALIQKGVKELENELGLTPLSGNRYKAEDPDKLINFLRDESTKRGVSNNVLESFEILKELWDKTDMKLDVLSNRDKVENILASIADSRVISQRVHGGSKVQAPSTFFEDGQREYNAKQELLSKTLKFYEDGTMEVLLPHYFKKTLGDVDITQLQDELLKAIGFRIPTSGLNSIEHIKIKGFLPQDAGETIIVPSEIVAKAGSDFDVDKLNIFLPNYEVKDGKPEYISYDQSKKPIENSRKQLENRMIELMGQIISHKDNRHHLLESIGNDLIKKEEASVVKKLGLDTTPATMLDVIGNFPYYMEVTRRNIESKQLTGIAALHTTDHVHATRYGYEIPKIHTIHLPHNKSGENISLGGKTSTDGVYISKVLNQLLNTAVDGAKDPIFYNLNINLESSNVVFYLVRAGVPLSDIMDFVNEPIIREYVQMKRISKSISYIPVNMRKESKRLKNKYKGKGFLLERYKHYEESSQVLNNYMQATRIDTRAMGKNTAQLGYILYHANKVYNKQSGVINADKLLHKNGYLNAHYTALRDFDSMFSNFFLSMKTNGVLKNLHKDVIEYLADKPIEMDKKVNILNKLTSDFITRNVLTKRFTIKGQVQQPIQNEYRLFIGKNTVAKKLLEYKKIPDNLSKKELSKRKRISSNPVVRELQPVIGKEKYKYKANNVYIDTIKLFNQKMDSVELNEMTDAFRELYEEQPKLAIDLVKMAFLQGGLQLTPNSFTKIIPAEIYMEVVNSAHSNFTGESFRSKKFLLDFILNNYHDPDIIPTLREGQSVPQNWWIWKKHEKLNLSEQELERRRSLKQRTTSKQPTIYIHIGRDAENLKLIDNDKLLEGYKKIAHIHHPSIRDNVNDVNLLYYGDFTVISPTDSKKWDSITDKKVTKREAEELKNYCKGI